MLIQQGKTAKLDGLPWAAIDLASDTRIEEVVVHISRWAHAALSGRPFQLLFPVKSRDLDGVDMFSPYLLARAENLSWLSSMQSIYGVHGLIDGQNGKILEIEEKFVRQVMINSKLAAMAWSAKIGNGSFVRILFGSERMLCGTVEQIHNSTATVQIQLRLRTVRVRVPVRALKNLGNVPVEQRTYFYAPAL